jgi:hypothetical protein
MTKKPQTSKDAAEKVVKISDDALRDRFTLCPLTKWSVSVLESQLAQYVRVSSERTLNPVAIVFRSGGRQSFLVRVRT